MNLVLTQEFHFVLRTGTAPKIYCVYGTLNNAGFSAVLFRRPLSKHFLHILSIYRYVRRHLPMVVHPPLYIALRT